MKLVDVSIQKPVATAVGVLLVALFGALALTRLPVQLIPSVEEPQISITTLWPGASPLEVEREIIEEQEEQLKSLEGMVEMESVSSDSTGTITLTFQTGTDLDTALLRASNRLSQVPSYPPDAERPVLQSVGAQVNPIAWFVIVPSDSEDGIEPYSGDIDELYHMVDDVLKPEIERVPGVAKVEIFGGRQREMQVLVDPERLAARQVTMSELIAAVDRENRNTSGGDFDEGKRRYVVRTLGEYESPEDIENVVIAVRSGVPVYLRDVARAELGFRKAMHKGFSRDKPMIAFNAQRESGANVLEVMAGLKATQERLDRDLMAPMGLDLSTVYDETDYIDSAIDLVQQSLILGGVFAIIILLLFLRSLTSTLVIAVAIPISAVGTFLMMLWLGRTLNVVSLAGMAFAIGMVVDNSIVVLENIYRHRQLGKRRAIAAAVGTREVWGAVLASTLTTIAVFLPVLFVREEAGQLFRDIAIAISCAVGLSLVVSITVIPSLAAKILEASSRSSEAPESRGRLAWVDAVAGRFTALVIAVVTWISASTARRLVVVVTMTAIAIGSSLLLMPQAEYLPTGNQNFLLGLISPTPGSNVEEVASLRLPLQEALAPMWEKPPEETVEMPGGGVEEFFFVADPALSFVGVRARDPMRVKELVGPLFAVNSQMPGAMAFYTQVSLFQAGMGESRNIDIDLSGPDVDKLLALAGRVFGQAMGLWEQTQVRTTPVLDVGNPELRLVPHRRRAAELGLSSRELGVTVSALIDGVKASEYLYEGREIDLKVMAEHGEEHRTHLLEQLPIATPDGQLITVGTIASLEPRNGPSQLRHLDRDRAVTVHVVPPETVPLQAAMDRIEREILDPLRAEGALGGRFRSELAGSADKLTQTGQALKWNFILALVITYLLMSALFEDFIYPFVILFSVPLAALGGFLGLALLNVFTYQALDILTMLGFIILVGTVVNNAILIVHQSLLHLREEGLEPSEAIRQAVRNRIRPIFMSVTTSVFGMLPLVLFPGAGSELYRGLGSVVVGGLAVSTVFTLFLIPALLGLTLELRGAVARRFKRFMAGEASVEPLEV